VRVKEERWPAPTTRTKGPYADRLNPSFASSRSAEEAQRRAAQWQALNQFINRHGGTVTSPPGDKRLRIEAPRRSNLANELRAAGYVVIERGSTTRIISTVPVSRQAERDNGAPSPFTEVDVIEIQLGGR
jgi:hypothetical protein